MLDVTVAKPGSSPRIGPWHGFVTRCLAMVFVLLWHLGLFLVLLRPPLPWVWRQEPSTEKDHALRIELLPRPRHHVKFAAATPNTAPPRIHAALAAGAFHRAAVPSIISPAASRPALDLAMPPSANVPYGNTRFAHALDDAQSTGLPQLPGANMVSKVPGIHVALPPSLKNRLHALVKALQCKDAIFKRRMTDEELLKRGLTHQQMDQKFAAECLP